MMTWTFKKAQLASILATAVDFGITFLLVQWVGLLKVQGHAIGVVIGGITYFIVGRHWVFRMENEGRTDKWIYQLTRYIPIWIGGYLLNVSGFYLFVYNYPGVNYMLIKTIVSVCIAILYNYPLQKRYVFKYNR
jgi:putative flippase GtrA